MGTCAMFTLLAEPAAPCTTIEEVGSTGVGALTMAFLILFVSCIVFVQKAQTAPNKQISYLCIYICGFAAMSYFAMLSGQGWTAVSGCRQFFYARYLDWMITFPLITILLGQIAGCEWTVIFGAIGARLIQLFAQYMGSVSTVTTVKWLWFLINIGALAGVLVHLARIFKAGADAKGGEVAQLYGKVGWMTILVWSCYPIVWLFSEGFSSFSVSFEVTMYAILDVINKVVLCFMVMSAQDAIGSDDAAGNREYV